MRYMLLMQATPADWQAFTALPREDLDLRARFIGQRTQQLVALGELVSEAWLGAPQDARLVRARAGGLDVGSAFAASKEFLVGYWVVDCDSAERPRQIAAGLSACPGRGGLPLGLAIEVRPLMMAPGQEM
jgi:hypothetical protein